VSVAVRLLTERDTDEITALVSRNLVFLAPWEPLRSDDYATEPIQRRMITDALARHADGASVPLVITLDDVIVGRINVAVALSFGEYGLHRLQAGTLVHNHRSQQVLERNGFTRIGLAPRYLRIAGEWQDHLLFQRLAD
jgi:ribosomal-protein-alanine N-acetyltransferase